MARFLGFILPGKVDRAAFLGAVSDIAERWTAKGQGSGPWWIFAEGKDAEAMLKARMGNNSILQLEDGTWRTKDARTMQEANILCSSLRELGVQQKKDLRVSIGAEGESQTIVREAVRGHMAGATSPRMPGLALRLPEGHKWAALAMGQADDDRIPAGAEAILLLPVGLDLSEADALRRCMADDWEIGPNEPAGALA